MGKPKPSLRDMKKRATMVPKGFKGNVSSSSMCKRDQERNWTLKGLRILGVPLVALLVKTKQHFSLLIQKVVRALLTNTCFLNLACLGDLHARFHGICTAGPTVGQ